MKIKQTARTLIIAGIAVFSLFSAAIIPSEQSFAAERCGGVDTAVINCSEGDGTSGNARDTGIWGILRFVINILTAGVAVMALIGIIWGTVLYTSAGGSPEQVKKAMGIYRNVVIGVVAFAGMWAILNFLIPGGMIQL